MSKQLWPVYEFRLLPEQLRGKVLRFAEGDWIEDDGEYDLAFIAGGTGAPMAYGVNLPHRPNIVWSWCDGHWSQDNCEHPRYNPWHYALRPGTTKWGDAWAREKHPNQRAREAAISHCSSLYRCANGSGPEFKSGDKWVEARLLREQSTGRIVTVPVEAVCMYCGRSPQSSSCRICGEPANKPATGLCDPCGALQTAIEARPESARLLLEALKKI